MFGLGTFGRVVFWALAVVGGVFVVKKYGPTVWSKTKSLVSKAKDTKLLGGGSGVTLVACAPGQPPTTGMAGIPPLAGKQSSALYKWCYLVREGDSSGTIAKTITGDSARYTEILLANPDVPKKGTPGVVIGADAWDFAPGTLASGAKLYAPQTMNAWIDQFGKARGEYTPWEPDARVQVEAKGEVVYDDGDMEMEPTYAAERQRQTNQAASWGDGMEGFDYEGDVDSDAGSADVDVMASGAGSSESSELAATAAAWRAEQDAAAAAQDGAA